MQDSVPLREILDFISYTSFGARHSIDVLDPEIQPGSAKIRTESGSRPLGLTEDGWHHKYETEKKAIMT